MSETERETVSFGYEEVPAEEKERRVGAVFSGVAAKYDVMNDAMSGGMHRLWKDKFVRRVKPQPGEQILDMAGDDMRHRPLALDAAGHLRAMDSGRPETLPLSQAAASLRLWESAGTTPQKPPFQACGDCACGGMARGHQASRQNHRPTKPTTRAKAVVPNSATGSKSLME